jgi:hypothetical protein
MWGRKYDTQNWKVLSEMEVMFSGYQEMCVEQQWNIDQ